MIQKSMYVGKVNYTDNDIRDGKSGRSEFSKNLDRGHQYNWPNYMKIDNSSYDPNLVHS